MCIWGRRRTEEGGICCSKSGYLRVFSLRHCEEQRSLLCVWRDEAISQTTNGDDDVYCLPFTVCEIASVPAPRKALRASQ